MDPSLFVSSGAMAVIASFLLQELKKASWFPWLTVETARLNLAASALIALASSVGIHYSWHGAENGTLLITGLTWVNLKAMLAHAGGQFAAQYGSYRLFVVPGELQAALVNQLKAMQPPDRPSVPPKAA